MDTHIANWYCCLNPSERGSLILCAAQAGPVTYFIVAVLFDTYWLAQIVPSSTTRKEIFIEVFGLIKETITPEGEAEIEVYALPADIWDDINGYLDVHGSSCAEPCKLLTFTS